MKRIVSILAGAALLAVMTVPASAFPGGGGHGGGRGAGFHGGGYRGGGWGLGVYGYGYGPGWGFGYAPLDPFWPDDYRYGYPGVVYGDPGYRAYGYVPAPVPPACGQ